MGHRIVVYSTDPLDKLKPADVLAVPAFGPDDCLLLDRYDGRSRTAAAAVDRPALLDALFCLRVGLADTLWLPDWGHLGAEPTRAVVYAEVLSASGSLVVGDRFVTPESATAVVGRELLDLACAAAAFRAGISPRSIGKGTFDPGDLWLLGGDLQTARLAHKLIHGFRLTQRKAVEVLNMAGEPGRFGRGSVLSESFVSGLLKELDDELFLHRRDQGRVRLPGLDGLLAAIGDDVEAATAAAAHWNAARELPLEMLLDAMPATKSRLAAMLELVRTTEVLDAVLLGDSELLREPAARDVVLAWLRQSCVAACPA